ncbi:hypothetical protein SAMD00023353_0104730 [Rosellinia necatrix]|uniref:Uncharacterized protein n=1 Tax=Rosellinia necatrix TaxID=77044 RepID=A0A1S8A4X1_ROSNE|nr:hypothetical protein SAMD00023353_0104730 [Rosellinia necatrix]
MNRCAKCATLRSDHLTRGNSEPVWDSVAALRASAEAGACDLCALCWAACLRSNSEAELARLLRGLGRDGTEMDDLTVWLEGLIYPSRPHREHDGRNAVWIQLGLLGHHTLAELSVFADPGLSPLFCVFVCLPFLLASDLN